MAAVAFPDIRPTGRRYIPGTYPQTVFQSQNGSTTVVRFGVNRVNATLSLEFSNITDADAFLIIRNYEMVNGDWDHVTFTDNDGSVGAGARLSKCIREEERNSGLRWRYKAPPQVTSVRPGLSSVQCEFEAYLDA